VRQERRRRGAALEWGRRNGHFLLHLLEGSTIALEMPYRLYHIPLQVNDAVCEGVPLTLELGERCGAHCDSTERRERRGEERGGGVPKSKTEESFYAFLENKAWNKV
jgi:hypothetical protein